VPYERTRDKEAALRLAVRQLPGDGAAPAREINGFNRFSLKSKESNRAFFAVIDAGIDQVSVRE